jgi:cytochrome b561
MNITSTARNHVNGYSGPLRLLHALLAISVTFQLVTSLVMSHPSPRHPMSEAGALYFHWHEWIGLAALAVLLVSWVYRVTTWKRDSHARLFPWLTRQGLHGLKRETASFLTLRWSRIPEYGALAGTVHGAGILLATAMAVTGGAIYVTLGPGDAVTPTADTLMNVHQPMGIFMWIYLCAHSIMALWHEYAGHGAFRRIFKIAG